ncbi:MAG: choice-of-anchor B family protein [Ignavibacteria bacterium]
MKTLLLFIISIPLYSQLPNHNMRLIANRNEHYVNNYSAIWGYSAPNDREYAILGCSEGTAFYDITDTNNIYESGFIQGLSSLWREFKTFGHYAYIVSEAGGSGLQIVDLQYLPDSVSLVNTVTFAGYSRTHTISQSGPYLYLNGADYNNAGIFIFDLSQDPVHPLKRGNWYENYIHDCRVVNDTIWAAAIFNGHIYVIDAVNKDSLRTITSWVNLPDPGPHNTAITGDRKFLLVTDEIGSIPRLLKTWNVQNVFNPQLVASWQPSDIDSSIVHNVEIYGNYALVAHYTAGVRLIDISNPAIPVEVAWYDTYPTNNGFNYNGCWGAYLFPSGKIIASDRATGLYVLKSSITAIGIGSNNNNNLPSGYSLKQNFPNPFNPVTKIEYSVPQNSYIRIKIYDLKGGIIGILSDKFEDAGVHSFTYDASRLSSGVYFYTLETGDGMILLTKKMVLVK